MENIKLENDSLSFKDEIDKKARIQLVNILVFYFIGISLLTTLVLMVPNIDTSYHTSELIDYDGNNFFYKWFYNYYIAGSYFNSSLKNIQPHYGFFILLPIISISFFVAIYFILKSNNQQRKLVTYISWILNLAPIIAYIVVAHKINAEYYHLTNDQQYYLPGLGLFPVYSLLPFHLIQIFTKDNFTEVFGIKKEITFRRLKRCFAITILFFMIINFIFPYLFLSDNLRDGVYLWFLLITSSIVYFYLTIFYLTVIRKQVMKRYAKELHAIFLPILTFWIFILYIGFTTPYYGVDDPVFELFHDITFPIIIRSLLIKWALALMLSFPIGFYSDRKGFFIITAIFAATIFSLMYLNNLPGLIRYYDRYTPGKITYYIIDPIINCSIFVLGAFVGKFLKGDFWPKILRPVV
ncbi:MAG: hypothetical protein KGD59_09765 [Candidatus Heimdallarchaeota archaeon]|nr:hypothetical protein [Candidatus Heimdallarchaeota archaeon]MBY8994822.1 hypothetical protein [Candidatus Heimdallarchaeota archaeon]